MKRSVEALRKGWDSAQEFWKRDMWRNERLPGLPPIFGGLLIVFARSLYIVIDAFRRDRIRIRAATLTFVTLLSLVPFLAVAFSLFTAFGGLKEVGDRVKTLVVDALAVQQRDVVTEYLDKFIEGANAGGLGAVGVITLFFTAVSTISNIETAFNDIWGVSEARGWIRRFQVYLPLIMVGSALLGIGISTIVAVEGSETVGRILQAAPALKSVVGLGQVIIYIILFFGFYIFLPNTRVHVVPALVGGLVASITWVIVQRLFTIYAARAISYSAIYGSFGAVPLTILWIYVSWTLVLLGATISFALQSARTYEPDRHVYPREREQVAARLVLEVARNFEEGHGPHAAQALIDEALVPPHLGRRLLEELVEGKVLIKAMMVNDEVGYAPAHPLDRVTLADVVTALRGSRPPIDNAKRAHSAGLALLDEAAAFEEAQLARLSLRELLSQPELTPPMKETLSKVNEV